MVAVKLTEHATDRIFRAVQRMVQDQGFKWNPDISDTTDGTFNDKEFKIFIPEIANTDFSNRQYFRLNASIEVVLFHNSQRDTDNLQVRMMQDAENIIFEIERFAPAGTYSDAKTLIHTSTFNRMITQPIKSGDDSRLRTTLVFDVTYRVKNPKAT